MPYRQIIYLKRTEDALKPEDVDTYHVMCQLYQTEQTEVVTILSNDDHEAETLAIKKMADLGFYVKVIALCVKYSFRDDWEIVYDERCDHTVDDEACTHKVF